MEFYVDESKVTELSLEELKKRSTVDKARLTYHFSSSKVKNYEGVDLKKLIKNVFEKQIKTKTHTEVVFEATDGYQAFSTLEKLLQRGGLVAYKDLDVESGWEPVGRRKSSPAPFFLVWTKDGQTTANSFPWPWALKKIRLVTFEKRYPNVYPQGAKKKSAIYKGFKTFKGQCFRCHAINKQGGKIGPDLGAPKNITSYRSDAFLKAFIKNPEVYRYSKMPNHQHLSDQEINQIISFLKSKKGSQ